MRRLSFACDIVDFNFFEPRFLKPIMQRVFCEPQPTIAIETLGLFKIVLEQINDDDLPVRPQYSVSG